MSRLLAAPAASSCRLLAQFLPGFALAFLGSIGWQIMLALAASLVAASPTLRQHTRHQHDLAVLLWVGGAGLHLVGLVGLIGRSRGKGSAGVWSAILLLGLLAWLVYQLAQIAAALRD